MVIFPNAKINLGLRVTGKRPDGYHDIETLFYPVPLKEALELTLHVPSKHHEYNFELIVTGAEIPGVEVDNLCYKAYTIIKKDFSSIPGPLRMHLHKAIPTGAGLGGGSSDGAAALKMLNEELKLNIDPEKLSEYALQLGSDSPFFLLNKPCLATGRGEILQETNLCLTGYYFVLVYPGIHISTAWAYGACKPGSSQSSITEIIKMPVETWKGNLVNDFEEPVFVKYPEIQLIRDELYMTGAVYASLTGSGSCVYGIFKNDTEFHQGCISGQHKIFHLKPWS
ncbi:MAG: 4-(cytidine 5'-diphospho)-2-C-methyl-D-erythritol kinase [Flavitalea sp.]